MHEQRVYCRCRGVNRHYQTHGVCPYVLISICICILECCVLCMHVMYTCINDRAHATTVVHMKSIQKEFLPPKEILEILNLDSEHTFYMHAQGGAAGERRAGACCAQGKGGRRRQVHPGTNTACVCVCGLVVVLIFWRTC
jgi:hypothetical protein